MIELKDHQKKPIEFMKKNRGLLLYHSTGSGKTLTALYSIYQFTNEIIIIGTKSSSKTFNDNIEKAAMDKTRFTFYTYSKIKKILETNITFFKNKSVIMDEAHNIRNENMYNLYIASALVLASKVILLTATPVVNYINDLSVLVNIIKGEDVLPTDRKLFDQMYYDDEKMILINKDHLKKIIVNTISYYKNIDTINYPLVDYHYENVVMSHEQINEYIYYIKKIIYEDVDIASDLDMLNLNYGLLPNKKRNNFLNVTRQLSNTLKNSTESPKIKEIFAKIQSGPYPIVVYSNFLKNGIYTLAVLLELNNISYKSITGFTSADKLNLIVNNYNNGLYKVLLISSAGSESLDLKKTRQLHIMELHWNDSRIRQVIGRVVRYRSHWDLPLDEQHVDIYTWITIFPQHIKNLSADQYLMQISQKKTILWDTYQELIISSSIEKNYFQTELDGGSTKSVHNQYKYKISKYNNKLCKLLQ